MTAQALLEIQCARLSTLDRDLPDRYPLPPGEALVARLPDGAEVAGVVTHTHTPPGTLRSLWSARDTYELFPLLGHWGQAGMDALLEEWRNRLAAPQRDSACLVTWPSRDVQATRSLLDHGLVPLTCLAVRPRSRPVRPPEPAAGVRVRRAGPGDVDAVVDLMLIELEYAALVGASVPRPDTVELKRAAANARLYSGDPVWLAERDGLPIALAECGWVETEHHPMGRRLRAGRWAYINCVAVRAAARGSGVGRTLMAVVHREFAQAGVDSFLYYNPANPLSSVFWPTQGYRPLWTIWEVRPATALR
jgi:GNAT superfamily N-acetyltransferase